MDRVRLDKWLWAARFFKTRSLATDAIDGGKVWLNGERVKPAKEVKAGDRLTVRTPAGEFGIIVKAVTDQRGNATAAQLLFDESDTSRAARAHETERKKRFVDPSEKIFARPTKKERRELDRFRGG